MLNADLTSAFLVGREVARHQLERGPGKIINVCSVQTDLARPSIAPGYIHTELTQALVDEPAVNSWILGRTPAARWGTADDLVGPAVFFASPASDYVNGQVLFIDGGMTAVV